MENGHDAREVKVLSSEYVVPAGETPSHSIWLSNIDLAANRKCYTPIIYLYRGDGSDGSFDFPKLKSALSEALVPFYPYAGEFAYDEDGRLEIQCTSKGVFFVEASCEWTVEEFGDFIPGPRLQSLFLPKAAASAEPPCPLVLLQVTRFKCGGVCLVTAVHHMLGDGTSSLSFISAWAAVCRGAHPAAISLPFVDRGVLKARSPPCIEYEHGEYDFCKPDDSPPAAKPSATRIFHLKKSQAAKLKSEGAGISTFSAVASHAWRSACKARKLPVDQPTRVFMSVDIRSRLDPPLPANFLGNAVLPTKVEATAGEVASGTIQEVGLKFEESKQRFHSRYFRSQIDFLETTPKTGRVRLTPGDVVAVNWLYLPIYEADFGWGSPVYIHRATLPTCGMVYVMRNITGEEGSLMVTVSLEEEFMEEFGRIFVEDLGLLEDPVRGDPSNN